MSELLNITKGFSEFKRMAPSIGYVVYTEKSMRI